jgi:hypothetical protein
MRTSRKNLALPFGAVVAFFAQPATVRAQDAPPPAAEHPAARSAEGEGRPPLRIGALVGAGFPRPLAVEGTVKLGDLLLVGAEYAVLPTVTIASVRTTFWSLAADARVFPLRGAFFVGVRAGRQVANASTNLAIAPYGSSYEMVGLDSWFVNPRVGFLWTMASGFTVGFEAGVQIPVASTTSSVLSLSLEPDAQRVLDSIGKAVLPTVDLIRIGLLR